MTGVRDADIVGLQVHRRVQHHRPTTWGVARRMVIRIGILLRNRATLARGRPVMAEGVGFKSTERRCSRILQTRVLVHSAVLPNDAIYCSMSGGIVQMRAFSRSRFQVSGETFSDLYLRMESLCIHLSASDFRGV